MAAGLVAVVFLSRDRLGQTDAPPFSLPETYGGRVDLASYKGRPVLLVFWTATCGICRHQLPLLNRMAPEFRGRGVEIATIHLGGKEAARDYLRANGIGLTALVDQEGAAGRAYGVSGVPKSVLVSADGQVLRSHAGLLRERELREWLGAPGR
jgi:peroxiredoxin